MTVDYPDKLVVVSLALGETVRSLDYETGSVIIDVYTKDSLINPVEVNYNIVKRIIALLDTKGSQLSDEFTSTVYDINKTDYDFDYLDSIHCYVGSITFDFFVKR